MVTSRVTSADVEDSAGGAPADSKPEVASAKKNGATIGTFGLKSIPGLLSSAAPPFELPDHLHPFPSDLDLEWDGVDAVDLHESTYPYLCSMRM